MEIDINYALVHYTTNINVMGMHWKSFGTAFWYDARLEDYHQACMRANDIVWNEIYEQFPHLKGTTFDYTESGDMPILNSVITELVVNPTEEISLEEQIKSCTELKVLESYKFIVKGKPEEKIYKSKLKELSK